MTLKIKFFILAVMSFIVIMNYTAFTQNKQQPETQTLTLASNNTLTDNQSDPVFYTIKAFKPAPAEGIAGDFTWDADGKTISFKEFTKNKVVFLNFWATWCPPCRKEIPDIIQLNKELSGKDFVVIGIAGERGNNIEANLKAFMKSKGITYLTLLASQDQLSNAYGGISGIPTTFIIDKKGNITERLVGGRDKETFMQSIKRVLK